jgi:hypothetical protein
MEDDRLTMPWRFPLTFAALTVAAAVLAAALVGHINLVELPAGLIARIDQYEIDDIVAVLPLIGVAFLFDQILYTRRVNNLTRLEREQLRVVQVTMRTVQDIVNNGLNQLQLLRFDAEGHVPPESLALFDDAIRETVKSLTALGDLEAYAEQSMVTGAALNVPAPRT